MTSTFNFSYINNPTITTIPRRFPLPTNKQLPAPNKNTIKKQEETRIL